MKKTLLSGVLILLCFAIQAQPQRGIKGGYDVNGFPEVSFIWNTPNPDPIESSSFVLTEDGKPLTFSVQEVAVDNKQSINKSVLVLWEDMASHSRQSDFTRELLTRFFQETAIAATDNFEVVVFDRQKDTEKGLLKPLIGQFTADCNRLAEAVYSYRKSDRKYATFSQQSDLYLAINEGIALLRKEPADRTGVIVVVTAGLNVKASGASTEMETVRKNALDAGIPIYVVKYPLAGNTPEVNLLAESTYGLSSSTIDVSSALENLQQQYLGMDNRLRGRDYRFVFTALAERDGNSHPMRLTVDKVRQPLPPYTAPKVTLGQWMVSHWWLVLIVAILIVGGIVLAVVFTRARNKKREQENRAMQEQMRQEHEESERRNREVVEGMRREQQAKEEAERREREEQARIEEENRLLRLMQTKNLFPRLQCKTGNDGFTYTIEKPHVTLGRNADNDVAFTTKNDQFNNMTVSGYHAEIHFNGTEFEIVNVSHTYTQGIVVNGQLAQRHTLRSSDMIGLGEALITFYV